MHPETAVIRMAQPGDAEPGPQGPRVALQTGPNLLAFARFILLPLVVVGIASGRGWLAFACMAAIVLSDLLDGRLARRLGGQSAGGALLDRVADSVVMYALFVALYAARRLWTYQFAILYVGMLAILALHVAARLAGRPPGSMRTSAAKLAGALQYGYLVYLTFIDVLPRSVPLMRLGDVAFWIVAGALLLNGGQCIMGLRSVVRQGAGAGSDA
jgi:cardiolipin synthase (CMP-forming)